MIIQLCSWGDVSWIPDSYNTEHALFNKRTKMETWFRAMDGEDVLGVGCLLHLNKTTVRHSNDFVIPHHRGRGVIKSIVMERENWAKNHGFTKADVRTVKKYYEPLGYRPIKEYKVGGFWYVKDLR